MLRLFFVFINVFLWIKILLGYVSVVVVCVGDDLHTKKFFKEDIEILQINKHPNIERIINAIEKCALEPIVVGNSKIKKTIKTLHPSIKFIEENEPFPVKRLFKALDNFEIANSEYIISIPSDLVLITREDIKKLLEICQKNKGYDLILPIIPYYICKRFYAGEKRIYVRLQEGRFASSHVQIIKPKFFITHRKEAEKIFKMRKSIFRLIRFLGIGNVFKYFIGRLSLKEIESRFVEKYHCKVKAICINNVNLTTDLSEPSDIEFIKKEFYRRQKGIPVDKFYPFPKILDKKMRRR